MKNTTIISAFPGTGKTYLYEHAKKLIVEKECWYYDKTQFPENYISEIKKEFGVVDVVFISTNKIALDRLIDEKVHITLIYPHLTLKDEYMERYRQRGSHPDFINTMDEYWHSWIGELDKRNDCLKHVLEHGQYINDIMHWTT